MLSSNFLSVLLFCFVFFSLEQSPAILAQLQRIYVITPDQPEAILLNPRVQVWFATPPPKIHSFPPEMVSFIVVCLGWGEYEVGTQVWRWSEIQLWLET